MKFYAIIVILGKIELVKASWKMKRKENFGGDEQFFFASK